MISPMISPIDFLWFLMSVATLQLCAADSSCNRTRLRRTREDLRKVPRWGPTELSLGAIASSRRDLSIDTPKKLHELSSETLWRGGLVVVTRKLRDRRWLIFSFFSNSEKTTTTQLQRNGARLAPLIRTFQGAEVYKKATSLVLRKQKEGFPFLGRDGVAASNNDQFEKS